MLGNQLFKLQTLCFDSMLQMDHQTSPKYGYYIAVTNYRIEGVHFDLQGVVINICMQTEKEQKSEQYSFCCLQDLICLRTSLGCGLLRNH